MGFECVSRTHVGLKRTVNEDSVLVRTDAGLWAVADGMGGHEAGDVASKKVVEALGSMPVHGNLNDVTHAAVQALGQVNSDLIHLARSVPRPRTIGSTVVGLAIDGGDFRCFWAGDSRAYRVRGGAIEQLSRDHSLIRSLIEAGMLSEEEARDHPDSNVITRAVGASAELDVDIVGGSVREGDMFLLASDGLTRLVSDDEIASTLRDSGLSEAADTLVDLVLERGAPDNVSMIILRIS